MSNCSKKIPWHYTVGQWFKLINATGILLTTRAEVRDPNERQGLWFSLAQLWEPTAGKALRKPDGTIIDLHSMAENHEYCGGLYRIGVDRKAVRLYDWTQFKRLSGIKQREASGLARAAIRRGSDPRNWLVSFEVVERDHWVAVETWDGKRWRALI